MKTYINPTLKVVELKTRNILMTSAIAIGSNYNGTADIEGRGYDFEDEDF